MKAGLPAQRSISATEASVSSEFTVIEAPRRGSGLTRHSTWNSFIAVASALARSWFVGDWLASGGLITPNWTL